MNGRIRFDGRVVIITGASQGIGLATALAFAREGAIPILISRSREKLDRARFRQTKRPPTLLSTGEDHPTSNRCASREGGGPPKRYLCCRGGTP
jgi:3-oxoacyl-[acyl-carrier protein] reductase